MKQRFAIEVFNIIPVETDKLLRHSNPVNMDFISLILPAGAIVFLKLYFSGR